MKLRSIIFILALVVIHTNGYAFPLDSVFARGDSCINITWTPDSINTRPDWYIQNGASCTGEDSVYLHCDFLPGILYRGIAYSYGGEDPHDVFRAKIEQGFPIGSHLCHHTHFGDPTTAIAGSDCSGFVCHVWNIARTWTGGLYADSRYQHISKNQLGPGDILVKPSSHTVLVVEKDDSTHFVIWESTSVVNGCRERLIDLSDTYWDAYWAIRNPDIGTGIRSGFPQSKNAYFDPHVTVAHRSRCTISFSIPFNGTITFSGLSGKSITTITIDTPKSNIEYTLPNILATGMYLMSIKPENGPQSLHPFIIR